MKRAEVVKQHAALRPSLKLLVKLGSIAVHADEMLSASGEAIDRLELEQLLLDADVQQWIKDMGALLPLKRKDRS